MKLYLASLMLVSSLFVQAETSVFMDSDPIDRVIEYYKSGDIGDIYYCLSTEDKAEIRQKLLERSVALQGQYGSIPTVKSQQNWAMAKELVTGLTGLTLGGIGGLLAIGHYVAMVGDLEGLDCVRKESPFLVDYKSVYVALLTGAAAYGFLECADEYTKERHDLRHVQEEIENINGLLEYLSKKS